MAKMPLVRQGLAGAQNRELVKKIISCKFLWFGYIEVYTIDISSKTSPLCWQAMSYKSDLVCINWLRDPIIGRKGGSATQF